MKKNYNLLLLLSCLLSVGLNAQQGSALNLDGGDDEIMCGSDPSILISGTAITLEARVKADAFTSLPWQGSLISSDGADTTGYVLRMGGAGVLSFVFGNGSGSWFEVVSPNNSMMINNWYHVAATYDGTMGRIFVDGVEVASQAVSFPLVSATSPLRLGESAFGGRFFDGSIDEVRIWNVVRTPIEIMDNIDNELILPQTGLAAYYKFNQGIAGGNNVGVTALTDEIGNNGGTLQNFGLNGAESNWVGDGLLSTLEFSLTNNVSLFPNPVKDQFYIQGLKEKASYTIVNLLGQEVKAGEVFTNSIETSNLKAGLYIVSLENLGSVKFIKQ